MNVLAATKKGQGQRSNDFCHAEEGEMVMFPFECDGESVDGKCGCRRSFAGFKTHRGTTTAEVVDRELTKSDYIAAYEDAMHKAGWTMLTSEELRREAQELLRLAAGMPVGVVIEKRGPRIQSRINNGGSVPQKGTITMSKKSQKKSAPAKARKTTKRDDSPVVKTTPVDMRDFPVEPKKAKAPAGEKPAPAEPIEKTPREDLMVFAFRLTKEESALIHKAAGPGKASRFVRALAVAAARKDEMAVHNIMEGAQAAE